MHGEQAAQLLKRHQIGLTYQRLAVLEELLSRRDHPRADDIWAALRRRRPPISKATVYNALRLLVERGIVRPLYIDADSVRYDIEPEGHGHFHCEGCGKVFNVPAAPIQLEAPQLEGFEVKHRDLYLRGLCPACLNQPAVNDQPTR